MGSEILRREDDAALPASTSDVEFALVLSRMIDSIKNDPQHLRQTVYELARRKLQEQFNYENTKDMRPISNALENAIQGVEAFSRKADQMEDQLRLSKPALEKPVQFYEDQTKPVIPLARAAPPVLDVYTVQTNPNLAILKKSAPFARVWRLLLLVAIVAVVVLAVRQKGLTLETLRIKASLLVAQIIPSGSIMQPVASPSLPAAAETPPKPSPLVPKSFGVFAVSDDKLYELELLPGRAPDIRVAISAAISSPSRTVLPDGHIRFIVYRRDSATNAADRAEVRVMAKVARATSFDNAGKPVTANAGDSWVIRNISIPFRTAPSQDGPDMYEVQNETPEKPVSPGRYALVLKGQVYDFTVAGDVADPKQCLERLVAANGQFYSECQKP